MEYKNIILEKKDGIARLILNRPPVNVINREAIAEINNALEDIKNDEAVKVLLFRGSGNKAFCAGVEVKDHIGDAMPKMMREFGKIFSTLKSLGKPSIAVVNGVALGGGCEVVAGCDMAIASEKAKFGQPEIVLGGLARWLRRFFPDCSVKRKPSRWSCWERASAPQKPSVLVY